MDNLKKLPVLYITNLDKVEGPTFKFFELIPEAEKEPKRRQLIQ